jgi:hypothetical protein
MLQVQTAFPPPTPFFPPSPWSADHRSRVKTENYPPVALLISFAFLQKKKHQELNYHYVTALSYTRGRALAIAALAPPER